ncbi:VWA domain-containing protein [Streptomyces sp. G-5]|uniref:VWA domain-containing protein n=1 Tax=Streptomyces sp. G-5 TaxID=2977231 RepID=UPI0021D05356|nr:VWA domain-containing protein [Streptomyces sp. G-5]MCU4750049.1 VWA domain-containing protein [Streptomyces sp. G-5]
MLARHHLQSTPPLTDDELDLLRWDTDGAPPHTPPARALDRHWLRIGAALSRRLPDIAGRDDVIVTCRPGTRSGAPAAFYPGLAELEIDASLFAPHDPAGIDPEKVGDEQRYPAAWGVFTHEAAHAAHSRWTIPPQLSGTAFDEVSALLEESRAEHAHLTRRPQDRTYLRAAVRQLLMADMHGRMSTDRWSAATAAALILARRDAGVLDPDETRAVETAVTRTLGPDVIEALATIWQEAHTTADDDGVGMLVHADTWCQVLGINPATPAPAPAPVAQRGKLADAISQVTDRIRDNDAAQAQLDAQVETARTSSAKAKAADAARNRTAGRTAKSVFTPGAGPYTPRPGGDSWPPPAITGSRSPTPAEMAAAARLARALRAAAYREPTTSYESAALPPGRLTMRQALALDAQLAAGATPTATPWTRTRRRANPTPPLRVGIALDVSGSMHAATEPIASAAWILARATALTDPDSRTAAIAFHTTLTAVTAPGRKPRHVTQLNADGREHNLAEAIDALTAGLDLHTPGAGRLLVIASDGKYPPPERERATTRITALNNHGCPVLWLAFAPNPRPLPGTTLIHLTTPAEAIPTIAKAATRAVQSSKRI